MDGDQCINVISLVVCRIADLLIQLHIHDSLWAPSGYNNAILHKPDYTPTRKCHIQQDRQRTFIESPFAF